MTRLIGTIAMSVLLSAIGSSARADGPWCAFYDQSTYNCGFYSYEQCYATVFGNGGSCRPNFFQGYGINRPVDGSVRNRQNRSPPVR